jgi:hypothetical protein
MEYLTPKHLGEVTELQKERKKEFYCILRKKVNRGFSLQGRESCYPRAHHRNN